MTFNPNIPQGPDAFSQSQSEIQTNFAQSNTLFDVDHYTFDDATTADRGKHRKSTYQEQAVDPVTVANEIAIFSKDLAGATRLYLAQEAAGTIFQLSGRDPSSAASGETYLPGGILLKWGNIAAATNGAVQTFPTPFPANCWMVLVTINIASTVSPVGVNGFNVNDFTFRTTAAGAVPITYIAIGE